MANEQNHKTGECATPTALSFERVPVCGNEIDAARDGHRVWISVRRVCESIGVDVSTQGADARVKNRIRFIQERTLRRELHFPMDRGCSWRKLSEEQFGRAMLILERMAEEADKFAKLSAKDQGPLFRAVPGPAKKAN